MVGKNTIIRKTVYVVVVILMTMCCLISCRSSRVRETSSVYFDQGYITTSGQARLYYETAGSGAPIILVHGHSLDARMWDDQFWTFAQYYRVVRYDCRGYGRSSAQSETFQFLHVQDLVTLMDSLHIERAHIVGLSMGGFITADMLVYAPDRMLSAVLANGHFRKSPGPSDPVTEEEWTAHREKVAAVYAEGLDTYKKRWFEGLMASGGSQAERMRQPLWKMIDEWDGWQATHQEVRLLLGRDGIKMLEEQNPTVPVLVLTGVVASDKPKKTPWFMQYLPNSSWLVIEDAGHMMNMERPEAFNAAVLGFISKQPAMSVIR